MIVYSALPRWVNESVFCVRDVGKHQAFKIPGTAV